MIRNPANIQHCNTSSQHTVEKSQKHNSQWRKSNKFHHTGYDMIRNPTLIPHCRSVRYNVCERIVKFLNCDCIRTEEQKLFINYYKNTEQLIALPWMPFLKCFITYCESTLGSEKNEMKAWVFGCHVYVILLTWSIYELQQTPLSEHSVSRNSG